MPRPATPRPWDRPAETDDEARLDRFERERPADEAFVSGPPVEAPWERPAAPAPQPDAPGEARPWRRDEGGYRPGPGGPSRGRPWQADRHGPPPNRYTPRPSGPSDPLLMLAEGEEIVAGRRPVEEAFVARREARRLLVVPQRRQALEKLVLHATSLRIPVVEVEGGSLTSVAGFDGHQGIALVVAARRYASPEEILARGIERHEPALVLALDSLEDPQNVGTLLRTAEATGVHGAIFPTRHQAPLTPAAIKASAGAVEHLRLSPVDDLPGALADLHARGLRIVGADGGAALTAREADLRGPIVIVVGSEGKGLGPAVRRRCDLLVRIPMHGHIESLNAAVAGSILLYEAAAQRRLAESPRTPDDDATADDQPEAPAPVSAEAPAEAPAGVNDAEPADAPVTGAGSEALPANTSDPEPQAEPATPDVRDPADDDLLPGGPAITGDDA